MTLQLLQQHGYDRLTVDAVAATARASKATVYRRWPSKAELVLAAFVEGIRQVVVPPDTGTLRGDLLQLGELVCEQARQHTSTIRAVLVEVARNPALNDVMQHQFVDQRKALMHHIVQQAVDRGEIDGAAIDDELWDVLPGYLMFRFIVPSRPPPGAQCKPSSTTSSFRASPDPRSDDRTGRRRSRAGQPRVTTALRSPVRYRTVKAVDSLLAA
ncbi:bacterial regulatory s, tetR family protein [Mycobacterium kansasii]|uniref:Bacterial regulatory s, tetR family protein n=1 Tax=Mycobacterium kansasii TaxID=1768 RepID=A0A1V3XN29_MYCKA|nr:bacterial regulatory s, tetR family protein [Mycobacterium kansasii]